MGLIVIVFTSIYYYNDSNNIYLDKLIKKEEFICNVKLDHKSYKVHLNDIIYEARSGSCMQMPISFSRVLAQ